MRKYVLKVGEKGPDALCVEEMTLPNLGAHEILVRMKSASINYRDLIIADTGVGQDLIPLSDGAGVVEATGEAVALLNTWKQIRRLTGSPFRWGRWRGSCQPAGTVSNAGVLGCVGLALS